MTFNVTTRPGSDKLVLNAILNQRSQDVLAANNWNVCQYAVLMHMLSCRFVTWRSENWSCDCDATFMTDIFHFLQELITRDSIRRQRFWLNPEIKDFYQFTGMIFVWMIM